MLALLIPAMMAVAAPPPQASPPGIPIRLSPAGQASAKKWLQTADPQLVAAGKQLAEIAQQMKQVSQAPRLDIARVTALFRQQEQVQTRLRRRANDRILAMLNEMSEADRLSFVRTVANPPAPQPGSR